jgi:monovalent cation:H+ antiporter, CPA1 family
MQGIGGVVLGVAALLSLVAFLPGLGQRLRLPYTVLLAGLGCVLGVAVGALGAYEAALPAGALRDFLALFRGVEVTADVLLSIFLPILLFETALNLDGRELLDDLGPILTLALVAVLITTVMGGLAVAAVSDYGLAACLLVAAIVATTDPVAVIAIFREVSAPRRLLTLVEGESLLNDAAAIVLFTTLLAVVKGQAFPGLGATAAGIAWEFAGGAAFGALLGRAAALAMGRIDRGGPAETTLSVAVAYLAYTVGDLFLHVSGVVAVVLAGLVLGSVARTRVAARDWQNVTAIWAQLGFWASSLIFVLASTLAPESLLEAEPADYLLLGALIAAALVARAVCLWGIVPFLTRGRRIDGRYKLVILWGGLRGAVTLALVLAVTESDRVPDDVRHLVSVLATGFVLFTLLVQGLTLRPLLRRLGLDQLDPLERLLRAKAMTLAEGQILKRLSEIAITYGIDLQRAEEVQRLYERRLAANPGSGDGDEMLRRQLLAALATISQREAQLYVEEQSRGMVSRTVGALLVRHAGRLIDALKTGGFDGYRVEARRQNRFSWVMRLAALLHRRTGLQGPLARRLALRAELLLVRQHALQEAIDLARTRVRALFGDRVAETAESVLEARVADVDRAIDALRLQYPDYWEAVSGLYLSRVAVRLELEAYDRMLEERLLTPQLHRNLTADLEARLRAFEKIPPLDLRLDVADLIASVPLLRSLGPEAVEELAGMLVPRLALPGERIVREGERGEEMFFIASGAVEVVLPDRRVRLGTGDFFGEMALLTRRPRNSDVVAIAYCRLLVLGREAFGRFLRTHPELTQRVREIATVRARSLHDRRDEAAE